VGQCVTKMSERLGAVIGTAVRAGAAPRAVIVGFPCDEGVRRNGGRVGAARAPGAIREALYRMLPDPRSGDTHVALLAHTLDLGDMPLSGELEVDQLCLGAILAPYIEHDVLAIVLGGGHETAYGHFLAYAAVGRAVTLLNWDAHTDVRELRDGEGHSGSPFRQALSHVSGVARGYTVAGLQAHQASPGALEFISSHDGDWVWRDDVSPATVDGVYAALTAPALVSFDMDVVDQSEAPGVSAPAVGGISADLWLRAADQAGRCPAVRSVDIVEVNPAFDLDGRTARLAALAVWAILRGRALSGGVDGSAAR
jgi:formiminoglutamase